MNNPTNVTINAPRPSFSFVPDATAFVPSPVGPAGSTEARPVTTLRTTRNGLVVVGFHDGATAKVPPSALHYWDGVRYPGQTSGLVLA